MRQPVKSVTEQTTLLEIAQLMLEHRIGSVLVVDGTGVLKGIITETDFAAKEKGIPFSTFRGPQLFHQWMDGSNLEELYREARTLTAGEIMTHHVLTVTEDTSMEQVLALMMEEHVYRVPVVRDGKPVGIIARHDLLCIMLKG
jgi:CBS domain-containing protein